MFGQIIQKHWYSPNVFLTLILAPVSFVFCCLVYCRRLMYRSGLFRQHKIDAPVIIVGNINVGGTGKTPLVTAIVKFLQEAGYQPGVISRGYGGRSRQWPQRVTAESDPVDVGDEAVLIAGQGTCPVMVGPDRVEAAKQLLASSDCNVIISDDGLQHYALARDIEIVVVDGERRFGNGMCLPAGPLRERQSRLRTVDFIIANGTAHNGEHAMTLEHDAFYNIQNAEQIRGVDDFRGQTIHALSGIGNNDRFFNSLELMGLTVLRHAFPDHYRFDKNDIEFEDRLSVIMTDKDAVKCRHFAGEHHWISRVSARVDDTFYEALMAKLKKKGAVSH